MFKPLFEFVREALFLQRDVRQLKDDIAKLERGQHETNEAVRQGRKSIFLFARSR